MYVVRGKYHQIINVKINLIWNHVQICSIVVQVGIQKTQIFLACSIMVQVGNKNIQKLCDQSITLQKSLTTFFYVVHYFLVKKIMANQYFQHRNKY